MATQPAIDKKGIVLCIGLGYVRLKLNKNGVYTNKIKCFAQLCLTYTSVSQPDVYSALFFCQPWHFVFS